MDYSKLFYYSEDSKTCLKWRITRYSANGGVRMPAGSDAGTLTRGKKQERKCANVRVGDKTIKIHRIIWSMFNGAIPEGMVIDHLNGDPWDNRVGNLVCKSQQHNLQNSVRQKQNSTGVKGIWVATMNGGRNTYIEAAVRCGKTRRTIRYSLEVYPYDVALQLAQEWRKVELQRLNNENSQYTERHINDTN